MIPNSDSLKIKSLQKLKKNITGMSFVEKEKQDREIMGIYFGVSI
jgi:hypothetical protein